MPTGDAASPQPWIASEAPATVDRRHSAPAQRNREPIRQVLREILPARGRVLEVASGSGEHVVHFARAFPRLDWQPSDPEPAACASIAAWLEEAGPLANVAPPLQLDAQRLDESAVGPVDAILCINMVHISPWAATLGLMRGAGLLLPAGAPLYLYGPYLRAEVETAASNLAFDRSLRARDPAWGLRDVADVAAAAQAQGLHLDRIAEMPANNLSLIFRRGPRPG